VDEEAQTVMRLV